MISRSLADVGLQMYLRHPCIKSLRKCQVSSDQSSKRSSPLIGGSSAQNMTAAMMTAQPGTTTLYDVRLELGPIQHHGHRHLGFNLRGIQTHPQPSQPQKKSNVLV